MATHLRIPLPYVACCIYRTLLDMFRIHALLHTCHCVCWDHFTASHSYKVWRGMEVKEDTSLVGAQESESQQCWSKLDQYATKNVLVISLSFLLLFTAFNGLQFLQSSLNTEAGLGLTSISVLYAVFTAANLLSLAPMVISKVGHKWAMVISMSAYLLWVLMNGCASWYTLVPAAVLVGLAAGPLWVAHSSYLTITATDVANKCGEDMEVIIHRYFGVFFFVFSLCKSYISLNSFLTDYCAMPLYYGQFSPHQSH